MPVLLLLAAGYLTLWPVPVEPVAWDAPPAPAPVARHAPNIRLVTSHKIGLGGEIGPEYVLAAQDGSVYAAVESGKILRIAPHGNDAAVFADTGGRPLGMAFDARGDLIVADAFRGLLSIGPDGRPAVLVAAGDGEAVSFPNSVAVARTGKIYLTDSSRRFSALRYKSTNAAALLEIVEQAATGRVLEIDPGTRSVRVLATGLSLANGIALTADERSLLVAESGRYRVWKIAIDADGTDVAQQDAHARILLDNLPGFPDNITRAEDGRFWLGLPGPRNGLDALARRPFLRKVMLRVPRVLWRAPAPLGHVVAFTEDGTIVDDLQDPTGAASTTTGLTETRGRMYIHRLEGGELSWIATAADGGR